MGERYEINDLTLELGEHTAKLWGVSSQRVKIRATKELAGDEYLIQLVQPGNEELLAYVWRRDATESGPDPLPRTPWSATLYGRRWIPWLIIDSAGLWGYDGSDPTGTKVSKDYKHMWALEGLVRGRGIKKSDVGSSLEQKLMYAADAIEHELIHDERAVHVAIVRHMKDFEFGEQLEVLGNVYRALGDRVGVVLERAKPENGDRKLVERATAAQREIAIWLHDETKEHAEELN